MFELISELGGRIARLSLGFQLFDGVNQFQFGSRKPLPVFVL